MVAQLTAKGYPDNWFSIGILPRKEKTTYDKNYDRDYSEQFNSVVKVDKQYYGCKINEISWLEGHIEPSNRFISSLKSSQTRPRYGQNGITSRGKRAVKGASALLQEMYGKERLGFCTLSIPNYCDSQISLLAQDWGNIVRVFFQKFKRELEKVGQLNEVVGVTEIQMKRFKKYGVIAPHIHFVYVCRAYKNSQFYLHVNLIRTLWKETLVNKLKTDLNDSGEEVIWGASVDCQVVKKNVSNYLGKYISKGAGVIGQIHDAGRKKELPRHWWTLSVPLRDKYKKSIKTLCPGACHLLFYHPEQALERKIIRWYKEVNVQVGEDLRLFGVVGYFYDSKQMHACVQ